MYMAFQVSARVGWLWYDNQTTFYCKLRLARYTAEMRGDGPSVAKSLRLHKH